MTLFHDSPLFHCTIEVTIDRGPSCVKSLTCNRSIVGRQRFLARQTGDSCASRGGCGSCQRSPRRHLRVLPCQVKPNMSPRRWREHLYEKDPCRDRAVALPSASPLYRQGAERKWRSSSRWRINCALLLGGGAQGVSLMACRRASF